MLQVAMWLVVRWDLVQVKEQTILMVSVASGFPTLLLYALQRTCLCQWVLHVVCDVWQLQVDVVFIYSDLWFVVSLGRVVCDFWTVVLYDSQGDTIGLCVIVLRQLGDHSVVYCAHFCGTTGTTPSRKCTGYFLPRAHGLGL